MINIGERIKETRKYFNLTQKEFGNIVGISYGHLSNIEKNKDKPSSHLVKRISNEFGINIEWLTQGNGEMLKEIEPIEIETININEIDVCFNNVLLDVIEKAKFMPKSEKVHYYKFFFHGSLLFDNILEISKQNAELCTITEKLFFILEMLSVKKMNSMKNEKMGYPVPYITEELMNDLEKTLKIFLNLLKE